jgi:hypothetical protein
MFRLIDHDREKKQKARKWKIWGAGNGGGMRRSKRAGFDE